MFGVSIYYSIELNLCITSDLLVYGNSIDRYMSGFPVEIRNKSISIDRFLSFRSSVSRLKLSSYLCI